MGSEKKQQERREYFRIKDWIIVDHELVDAIEEDTIGSAPTYPASSRITLLQELSNLEKENQAYLCSLNDKQSQLGQYLLNLNKKVELLTHFVVQSINNEPQGLTEVDISGGGIRFSTNQQYNIDQLIKLEIVLVPDCIGFVCYGRVIDCTSIEATDKFQIALIFVKLDEFDRDAIIRHVFTLQSKQLRDKRISAEQQAAEDNIDDSN